MIERDEREMREREERKNECIRYNNVLKYIEW